MSGDTELYRMLSLVRAVENKIIEVYPSDVMQTPVHLSIGQEAISVALCNSLTSEDWKIGTHRSHALYIANGGDLAKLFAELLGKPSGCSGGMGGSMHLTDPEHGLFGTTSIVGGCLPIACGLAEAIKPPHIVACVFGDGAADQGVFAEALNWAALRSLPVLFVCEENDLSVNTQRAVRRCALPTAIPGAFMAAYYVYPVDAMEVRHLGKVIGWAIAHIRACQTPYYIGVGCTRAMSHNGIKCERELGECDPVEVARREMQPSEWQRIDSEVQEQVEGAYAEALG